MNSRTLPRAAHFAAVPRLLLTNLRESQFLYPFNSKLKLKLKTMENRLIISIAAIFASASALFAAEAAPAAQNAPCAAKAQCAAAAAQNAPCAASEKEVNALVDTELLSNPLENFSASATVAYESEYIFRGKAQAGHGINPMVDLGYDFGNGLAAYAEYWGFYGVDNGFGENDFYAGLTYTIENITFDVGYLGYTYNDDSKNESEFMVAVSYDTVDLLGDFNVSPFAAFYYNYTYSGTTVEGGLSYEAPVTKWLIDENWGTINLAAYVGYADYRDGLTYHGGYVYTGVSADAVVQVTDNMAISAGIRWACNNDGADENIGGKQQNLWFGTAVIFGF